jgi:translation initiation factor IF-3
MIRIPQLRVVDENGEQLGILERNEALEIARERGLDLVEVAPNARPPVCRIMDYGKFKYQTSKKVQETRKKSRSVQVKEIKLRPHTEDHDLGFKIKNLKKFLEKKDRVKVSVTFRGREMAYMNAGVEILQRVAEEVGEQGTVEQPPTQEGRNRMTMVIVPK